MTVHSEELIRYLEEKARIIRRHVIIEVFNAGSGHPGGSLSCADIMAALYFHIMKHDPRNPKWRDRDRVVLSKGHSAPALYAALAETGYFPVEELKTLRKMGSMLQGHPDMLKTPGVEASTGSLGQGLSIACGMAAALKLDGIDSWVYVIMGDGEMDSGQIWEASMFASHYRLDNIIGFVDRNRLQIDGNTEDVMSLEPLHERWASFGWHVQEIDGHNMREILKAVDVAKSVKGRPKVIIAHTVKGKGVSFMENSLRFHGKAPNEDEFRIAMKELGADVET